MGRGGAAWCLLAGACAIGACANILGIDDGIPRQPDASIDAPAVDASTGADVVSDAAIDVPMSPLVCGTSTCNALEQACCRLGDPLVADAESFACVSDAAACSAGLLVTCDEAANCAALGHAGDVCCALIPDGGTAATATKCMPAASCGVIICEPGDDEACDVDAGQSCAPSIQTILGYDICKT